MKGDGGSDRRRPGRAGQLRQSSAAWNQPGALRSHLHAPIAGTHRDNNYNNNYPIIIIQAI
jgi:hypothetical protein